MGAEHSPLQVIMWEHVCHPREGPYKICPLARARALTCIGRARAARTCLLLDTAVHKQQLPRHITSLHVRVPGRYARYE